MGASVRPDTLSPGERIRQNIAAMRAQGATDDDVEAYLTQTEGLKPLPVSTAKAPVLAPRDATAALPRPVAAPHTLGQDVTGGLSAVTQGATGGLGDEIAAIGAGLVVNPLHPLKHYEQLREQAALPEQQFAANHPVLDMAGQVGGAVGGTALAGGVANALRGGAPIVAQAAEKVPLLQRTLNLAKTTGAAGAVGAGVGAASANPGNRLAGAEQGAKIAGELALGAKAAGPILRATGLPALVRNVLPRPATDAQAGVLPIASHEAMAARGLLDDFARSGMSVDQYLERAKANPDHPLYDLGPSLPQQTGSSVLKRDPSGDPLVRRARGVQSIPSRGSALISDFTNARAEQRPALLRTSLESGLGETRQNVVQSLAQDAADRTAASNDFYAVLRSYYDPAPSTGAELPAGVLRDEDGEPLRLYHGTSREFSKFDMRHAGAVWDDNVSRAGVNLTTDPEEAKFFANKAAKKVGGNARVVAVHTTMRNPAVITDADLDAADAAIRHDLDRNHTMDADERFAIEQQLSDPSGDVSLQLKRAVADKVRSNHDGIIIKTNDNPDWYIVRDPEAIVPAETLQPITGNRVKSPKRITALDAHLGKPSFESAIKETESILRERDPQHFTPLTVTNGKGVRTVRPLTFTEADLLKRSLDDVTDVAKVPNPIESGGVTKTRRMEMGSTGAQVTSALDDAFPGNKRAGVPSYHEIRGQHQDASVLIKAKDAGQHFTRTNADQLEADMAEMTPAQLRSYRQGAIGAVEDDMAQGRIGKWLVGPNARKLRLLFPDQPSYDRFEMTLRRQVQGSANDAMIMRGSPTARIQAEQADLGGGRETIETARRLLSPTRMAEGIASSGVANRLRGLTEARADALAPYLTASGPALNDKLLYLKALQKEMAQAAEQARLRNTRAVGQVGGIFGANSNP